MELLGFENYADLKDAHFKWSDSAMETNSGKTESRWTQSIAVGSKPFIENIKKSLGFRARGRNITSTDDSFEPIEGQVSYDESDKQEPGNSFLWQ
jgi:putative transposase